jgi:hypothetical protein
MAPQVVVQLGLTGWAPSTLTACELAHHGTSSAVVVIDPKVCQRSLGLSGGQVWARSTGVCRLISRLQ